MNGIYFLCFLVAFGVVFHWARKNDKVPLDGRTSGLLRMDDGTDEPPPAAAPDGSQAQSASDSRSRRNQRRGRRG